jgi:hypothetical protein
MTTMVRNHTRRAPSHALFAVSGEVATTGGGAAFSSGETASTVLVMVTVRIPMRCDGASLWFVRTLVFVHTAGGGGGGGSGSGRGPAFHGKKDSFQKW